MKDMGKGNIYQVCKKVRMNGIFGGIAMLFVWVVLYYFMSPGKFVDMFYGINRIYLLFFVVGIGLIVVNGFFLLFGLDKKRIRKLVAEKGIYLEQFEANLDEGTVFCQKLGRDIFFISTQFGLLRERGRWVVIRTQDIMKMGIDSVQNGKTTIERLHCLMKDGSVYTMAMPAALAAQAADFLKKTVTSESVITN